MTNEVEYQTFRWGPLVLQTKITSEFLEELLKRGKESRKSGKSAKEVLAGRIEDEFFYEDLDDWLMPSMHPYVETYMELVNQWAGVDCFAHLTQNNASAEWNMDMAWINFQKRYEYNPPHNHPCDLSFVAYLNVPDEIRQEQKKLGESGRTAKQAPGVIYFDYGEQLPFSVKSMGRFPENGDLFLFPGWLKHHVHAFKSNVERISASGNINFISSMQKTLDK